MANVFTVARDDNNDIFIKDGKSFAIVSGIDAYAQIINAKMRTIKGELILDTENGLPYFENVFLDSSKIPMWIQRTKTMLNGISFVKSVERFDAEVSNGVLVYNSVIVTDLGELPIQGNIQFRQRKKKEEEKIAYIVRVHTGIESIPDYDIALCKGDVIAINERAGFNYKLYLDSAHTKPSTRLMPSNGIDVYVEWIYDPESGISYEEAMMPEWRMQARKFDGEPTVWIFKVNNAGDIGTVSASGLCAGKYIKWGDGEETIIPTVNKYNHTYSAPGYYMVASTAPHSYISDNANKVVALVQIGNDEGRSWINNVCYNCSNMKAAYIEIPQSVLRMKNAFKGCSEMIIVNDVSIEDLCPSRIEADQRSGAYSGCSEEIRSKAYVSFGGTVPDPTPEQDTLD